MTRTALAIAAALLAALPFFGSAAEACISCRVCPAARGRCPAEVAERRTQRATTRKAQHEASQPREKKSRVTGDGEAREGSQGRAGAGGRKGRQNRESRDGDAERRGRELVLRPRHRRSTRRCRQDAGAGQPGRRAFDHRHRGPQGERRRSRGGQRRGQRRAGVESAGLLALLPDSGTDDQGPLRVASVPFQPAGDVEVADLGLEFAEREQPEAGHRAGRRTAARHDVLGKDHRRHGRDVGAIAAAGDEVPGARARGAVRSRPMTRTNMPPVSLPNADSRRFMASIGAASGARLRTMPARAGHDAAHSPRWNRPTSRPAEKRTVDSSG